MLQLEDLKQSIRIVTYKQDSKLYKLCKLWEAVLLENKHQRWEKLKVATRSQAAPGKPKKPLPSRDNAPWND